MSFLWSSRIRDLIRSSSIVRHPVRVAAITLYLFDKTICLLMSIKGNFPSLRRCAGLVLQGHSELPLHH